MGGNRRTDTASKGGAAVMRLVSPSANVQILNTIGTVLVRDSWRWRVGGPTAVKSADICHFGEVALRRSARHFQERTASEGLVPESRPTVRPSCQQSRENWKLLTVNRGKDGDQNGVS